MCEIWGERWEKGRRHNAELASTSTGVYKQRQRQKQQQPLDGPREGKLGVRVGGRQGPGSMYCKVPRWEGELVVSLRQSSVDWDGATLVLDGTRARGWMYRLVWCVYKALV